MDDMPEFYDAVCENCEHNVPKDRREDFGDVCERWCDKCRCWLDMFSAGERKAPCGKETGR